MRPILFRGKDTITGEWAIGDLIQLCDNSQPEGHTGVWITQTTKHGVVENEVDPETVGQLIGLKGINVDKVFEDDIIKTSDSSFYVTGGKYKIIFNGTSFIFYRDDKNYLLYPRSKSFEVIGNIHDNPELLKETEELKP